LREKLNILQELRPATKPDMRLSSHASVSRAWPRFRARICQDACEASFVILRSGEFPVTVEGYMHNESLRELYPALTDEEQKIAAETLDRFLELAWEIYQTSGASDPTP
jgi:hypothetical protein